jgi:hypothetical protein
MGSGKFRLWSMLVPLAAALLCTQPAFAGGFYVSEVGTPGSLGTAGVANPTKNFGPNSAWTDPAGMTGLDQDTIVSGLQFIVPWAEFDTNPLLFVGATLRHEFLDEVPRQVVPERG